MNATAIKLYLSSIIFALHAIQAQWVWTPEAGWINSRYDPRAIAQVQYNEGQELLRTRDYTNAAIIFQSIVEKYADTPEGKESLYLIGECFYASGNYYESYLYYEKYRIKYPTTHRLKKILEREYQIGCALILGLDYVCTLPIQFQDILNNGNLSEYLRSELGKQGCKLSQSARITTQIANEKWVIEDNAMSSEYLVISEKGKLNIYRKVNQDRTPLFRSSEDFGIEILNTALQASPYAGYADKAQLTIADYYFHHRDYEKAQENYLKLLEKYPKSELCPMAQYQMAMCSTIQYHGPDYDREPLSVAKKKIEEYPQKYGAEQNIELQQKINELNEVIREKEAQKELHIAMYYLAQGEITSAKIYLYSIIKDLSKTPTSHKAMVILQELKKGVR